MDKSFDDIYVCPEKILCVGNLNINKKVPPPQKKIVSQEVAENIGASLPMYGGGGGGVCLGSRRKVGKGFCWYS